MPLGAVLVGSQLGALAVSLLLTLGAAVALTATGLASAVAAGASNAAALACFCRAGRTGNLSLISPIGAAGAVVPVAVGVISGDRPSLLAALGIPIVLVGIVLAAPRPAGDAGRRAAGVGWALAAAALSTSPTAIRSTRTSHWCGPGGVSIPVRVKFGITIPVRTECS